MRIIHAGNFSSRPKGAYLHSVEPKLSRGFARAGHCVIDFSDREAARAGSLLRNRKLGVGAANRAFARLVSDVRPDLLVLGMADVIRAETVAALRRALPSLRVVQWNVDPLFEPDNIARLRSKLEVVDATLVSTAGDALRVLARPGMRLGFLPNPVDFSIESGAAHTQASLPWDVFYACGHPTRPMRHLFGQEWDMDRLIGAIRQAAPGLRFRLAGLSGQTHLVGAAYQDALSSSAMGLNISRRNDEMLYSSDRLAHMIGNGQAILIDRATGYGRLFTDAQMAFFSTLEELAGHLRRLAAEPGARQALAGAGRARYHALFNETIVAGYIVDVAFGNHDAGRYEWPTLVA